MKAVPIRIYFYMEKHHQIWEEIAIMGTPFINLIITPIQCVTERCQFWYTAGDSNLEVVSSQILLMTLDISEKPSVFFMTGESEKTTSNEEQGR